jgi:fluoride exporter
MNGVLLVALGGALGALARYGLTALVALRLGAAPWLGTLLVNLLGCLAIGLCYGWLERSRDDPVAWDGWRLFAAMGLLGSFTTFSTFSHETLELLRRGALGLAAANAVGQVLLGLAAVWLGRALVNG